MEFLAWAVPAGILLPEAVLQGEFFAVLAAFVAMNTLIYVTMAIGKMLPRPAWSRIFHRRNRRKLPRSVAAVRAEVLGP